MSKRVIVLLRTPPMNDFCNGRKRRCGWRKQKDQSDGSFASLSVAEEKNPLAIV
jgi:hypothetical protein